MAENNLFTYTRTFNAIAAATETNEGHAVRISVGEFIKAFGPVESEATLPSAVHEWPVTATMYAPNIPYIPTDNTKAWLHLSQNMIRESAL